MSQQIPITSLHPETPPPPSKSIRAIITLAWPYSSSTHQCALLLSDPDFRLRHHKGQVRVRFTGASAQAVAQARVGIGDEVLLGLEGAVWAGIDEGVVRTPGRSVEGELVFGRRVGMRVWRAEGGAEVEVHVDAAVSPPSPPLAPLAPRLQDVGLQGAAELVTPGGKDVAGLRTGLEGVRESLPSFAFASPAFVKRLRLDGEAFLDSAYDPFVADDVGAESSKEGMWTSFGRKLNWRYSEKTPSPKKVHFAPDGSGLEEEGEEVQGLSESVLYGDTSPSKIVQSGDPMLPPPLPHISTSTSDSVMEDRQREEVSKELQEGPSTPKLQPVDSWTLPLPSPFPAETRQTQFEIARSALNQSQEASVLSQKQPGRVSDVLRDGDQSQDVEMLDQQADILEQRLRTSQTDTEPDDEATQQMLMERHGVRTEDVLVQEMPRTPERSTQQTQRLEFGLDGANSAPPSAQVTPQSEKERIMAQTYRSLFGFQDPTTSPTQPQVPQQLKRDLEGAKSISDMSWGRLQAAGIATIETQKAHATGAPQTRVSPSEKQDASSPTEQSQPESALPPPSSRTKQIEVIDLDSSSEGEDELHPKQDPALPATQRRMPKLEIQASLADSETEDLLVHPSRSRQSGTSARRREKEPSETQSVVAEEHVVKTPKLEPPIELDTGVEDEADVAVQEGEVSGHGKDELRAEHMASSAQSEHPPEVSETPDTAIDEARINTDAAQATQVISSPLSSPPAWLSGQPGLLAEELFGGSMERESQDTGLFHPASEMHHIQESVPETEPPLTTSRETVIELGLSSTAVQPLIIPMQAESAGRETLDELAKTAPPVVDEQVEITESSPQELQSEFQLKSPSIADESQPEKFHVISQEHDSHLPHQRIETPLYPSLPLSPSYSQPLSDMPSQPAARMVPGTVTSALPPTPQLTQVESFTDIQAPLANVTSNQALEATEPSTQPQQTEEEAATPKVKKKTPAKKSLSSRLSDVPAVISPWFSPKRASIVAEESEETANQEQSEDGAVKGLQTQQANGITPSLVNGHTLPHSEALKPGSLDTHGFSTSLSYFTPLSKLDELLNPSSQQAYGTNTIDVLAIVTDGTKEPVRAKTGPRDYFTIFKISDQSASSQNGIRVEIYRPWRATLPVAAVGDVILLRAFAVKSRKRQPYLLSTDASAWCVWRYEDQVVGNGDDGRPIWARRTRSTSGGVREEMKGPPVELGDEEREYAGKLREWWQAVRGEDDVDQDVDSVQNGSALNGHVVQSVSANL